MSQSDDSDFGGLAPTTPLVRLGQGNLARATKLISRVEPGPSSNQPSKIGRKNGKQQSNSDIEEVTLIEDVVVDSRAQPRTNKPPSRADAPAASGKQKGKAKAKAVTKQKQKSLPDFEVVDEEDGRIEILDKPDEHTHADTLVGTSTSNKRRRIGAESEQYVKDNGVLSLAEQLRWAQKQIATLSKQLEEAFKLRETEAEALMKQHELQHDAVQQAQEALIKDLTSQLARKEPLTSTGKASILHLITREAADEEKRTMKDELDRWQGVDEEHKRRLQEKDNEITLLREREKDLQYEIKHKNEENKDLKAKLSQHSSAPPRFRAGTGAVDPKHGEVVRFYEDLTNLLVTNLKLQPATSGPPEWTLTCIFTYVDSEAPPTDSNNKSLSFTLRTCEEPAEGADPSSGELVQSVHYIPLELDKEPPDFVEKLGFLGGAFTFPRDQLSLFLRTIYTNVGDTFKDEPDDGDSVQIVETPSPR